FYDTVGCEYSLFEHGHGQFCSSFGDLVYAHAHLLPSSNIGRAEFDFGVATSYPSILSALSSVPARSEYLLWGSLSGSASLIVQPSMPKRAIRQVLGNAKIGH